METPMKYVKHSNMWLNAFASEPIPGQCRQLTCCPGNHRCKSAVRHFYTGGSAAAPCCTLHQEETAEEQAVARSTSGWQSCRSRREGRRNWVGVGSEGTGQEGEKTSATISCTPFLAREPKWATSILCPLNSGQRSDETHWGQRGFTRDKQANATLWGLQQLHWHSQDTAKAISATLILWGPRYHSIGLPNGLCCLPFSPTGSIGMTVMFLLPPLSLTREFLSTA